MSVQARNWARKQRVGDGGAKAVLMALADRADRNGRCYPSQQQIQEDTEFSESTVRRYVKLLEQKGLIQRRDRRRKNGSRAGTDYQLMLPGADDLPVRATGRKGPGPELKNTEKLSTTYRSERPVGSRNLPVSQTGPTGQPDTPRSLLLRRSSLGTDFEPSSASVFANAQTDGAEAPPENALESDSDEIDQQLRRWMPLLRELRYQVDDQAGSTMKSLLRKHKPDELEAAVRGLALMRDRGELRDPHPLAWKPTDTLLVTALNANGRGKRPWFNEARDAWMKHLEKNPADGPSRIHVQIGVA